jgi:hypothetical protein
VQVVLKKGETILTDASLHLPAACLRKAFSDRSGVPPEHFELYYRGKRLEGEAALGSWGVEKDATIEVKMRGRGGGCVGAKEASSVKEAAMAAMNSQFSLAAVRLCHSPTSTSQGHRFDNELNRLAAQMSFNSGEEVSNAAAPGKTVQARSTFTNTHPGYTLASRVSGLAGASGAQETQDHHDRRCAAPACFLSKRGVQQPLWSAA